MEPQAEERSLRASADFLTGVLLTALGLAVLYLSWTMPRLAERRIHPATIPGLVPILLGAALALCGALLAWRSWRIREPDGWARLGGALASREARRVAAAGALVLVYTLGLVGSMPFAAASALFIAAFILTFEVWLSDEKLPLARSLPWALLIAVIGAGGVYLVFQRVFLVRLP